MGINMSQKYIIILTALNHAIFLNTFINTKLWFFVLLSLSTRRASFLPWSTSPTSSTSNSKQTLSSTSLFTLGRAFLWIWRKSSISIFKSIFFKLGVWIPFCKRRMAYIATPLSLVTFQHNMMLYGPLITTGGLIKERKGLVGGRTALFLIIQGEYYGP